MHGKPIILSYRNIRKQKTRYPGLICDGAGEGI